jgi:hypothetical protein
VPALVATFRRLHEAAIGQPYPPAWGRDGKCLKRALVTWSPGEIERAMHVYFDARDERLQIGADVAMFVKRIPTLLARTKPARSRGFVG